MERAGHTAIAPDLRAAVAQPAHAPAWLELASSALASRAATASDAETAADDAVLVAHSGAGRLVAGVHGDHRAIVLVDAGLPGEPTHRAGAPPEFDDLIAQLAGDGGVLPPWPEWWPPAALEALVPDPGHRALLADAPRAPVALFGEPLPAACRRVASSLRVSFLLYGDGYVREAAEAATRGWTVERIEGMHVHHLVDPDDVAAAIIRLAGP